MIIDFHTHIFPDTLAPKVIAKLEQSSGTQAFVDGTLQGLKSEMARAGVSRSATLPVASAVSQVVSCNNFAAKLAEENPKDILSFGAMHPDFSDYKQELKRIKELGLHGIKLHPDYQEVMFDDLRYKRIVDTANALGLTVVVHAGLDIGLPHKIHATPHTIKNLVTDVKPTKLVLAHMGGFQLWNEVAALLCDQNLYLDTSFSLGEIQYHPDLPMAQRTCSMMAPTLFMKMLAVFGADHLLFATDSPWGGQIQTLQAFNALPLTDQERSQILWKNATKLLGLSVDV